MPSPFPGMDSFLEESTSMNFHNQLCAEIARQLNPKLRPRYVARLTESFFTEFPEDLPIRTVSLARDRGLVPNSVLHFAVEIRAVTEHRLVTSIKLLSPTTKRGDGHEEYRWKRNGVLTSKTHLLEIDLLRRGQRVPTREPLPDAPYFIFLSRSETRPVTEVWPIDFDQSLPTLPVPLLLGDSDALLDLQLALTNVYDICAYDLQIDYSRAPELPLSREQASWVEKCLRAAGLRKGSQEE